MQRFCFSWRSGGKALTVLLAVPAFLVFAGCQSVNYNRDLLMGILWQQQSGEYSALCWQAFNAGKAYIRGLPAGGPRAVVLDIDETVLDNSRYAAWMVRSGEPWSAEAWERWCKAAAAPAVPGSLDFANFLDSRGIAVYYVSNRPASVTDHTVDNLKALGFPSAVRDHVLLQESTSDKAPRLEQIRALGYELVLLAGDSLEDLDSGTRRWSDAERRAWVDTRVEQFGRYWLVLPNAVYGAFESAIRDGYYGLSPEEKARSRLAVIEAWEP
jgi:5'-nucleotidase (lipoprotein e(P4) family)